MDQLRGAVRRVAESPYPVLVIGESGSGKELVGPRDPPAEPADRPVLRRGQLRSPDR